MYDAAFNNIENILRAEDGIANELDYVEQISWLLFLKYLSDLESERKTRAELDGVSYEPIIASAYTWSGWAYPISEGDLDDNKALTGDDLVTFVDQELFPYLGRLKQSSASHNTINTRSAKFSVRSEASFAQATSFGMSSSRCRRCR